MELLKNQTSITDELIDLINVLADEIIITKKKLTIDYDFLEKILGATLINEVNVPKKPKMSIKPIIPIEKSKMLSIVLDFFKSIDEDFYKQAVSIMLHQNKNLKLNIYNINKINNFNQINEMGILENTERAGVFYNGAAATINIPTKRALSPEESEKVLKDNECLLEDAYVLVHEIGHLLDCELESKAIFGNDILSPGNCVTKTTVTSYLLTESTAATFEMLFTEYLLANNICSKDAVIQISNEIFERWFEYVQIVYIELLLAKEKELNETISKEFIEKMMKQNGWTPEFVEKGIKYIVNFPDDMVYASRYAIANLVAPTIAETYNQKGAEPLLEYCEMIKSNNLKKALKTVGISLNQIGIEQVINKAFNRVGVQLRDRKIEKVLSNRQSYNRRVNEFER